MFPIIKQIESFPGYFIDKSGSVYSNKRNNSLKKLNLDYNTNEYAYVNLYNDGNRSHCRVHRLVAAAFIQNDDNEKIFVNHIDGDKRNNHFTNLEWCTPSYNNIHSYHIGTSHTDSGYEDSQSCHIIAISCEDNKEYKFGSASQAAEALGISLSTILRQANGITKADYRSKYKFYKDDGV